LTNFVFVGGLGHKLVLAGTINNVFTAWQMVYRRDRQLHNRCLCHEVDQRSLRAIHS